MNSALQNALQKMATQELPGIRQNFDQFKIEIGKPNVEMELLGLHIEKDIALSLRLLRQINEIQFRKQKDDVDSISQARLMFGIGKLRSLTEKLPTIDKLDSKVVLNYLSIVKRYYHAAHIARRLAQIRRDPDPNAIFAATFLHCIGELLLWISLPNRMFAIQKKIRSGGTKPEEAQYVELGFPIEEFTREMAKIWHLPVIFRRSLYPENSSDSRVATIMTAVDIAHLSITDWYSQEMRDTEESLAKLIHRNIETTVRNLHIYSVEAAHLTDYIRLPHPAANLIYPAYPLEEPEQQGIPKKAAPKRSRFCLAPRLPIVSKNLKKLAANDGSMLFKEIIQAATNAMHDGLGLNRVVYAVLVNKRIIKARSIIGNESDVQFNKFALEVVPNGLFAKLAAKQQSIWIGPHNLKKFWPLIPVEFQQQIKIRNFYFMSLHSNGKLVGFFYADRHMPDCLLDERSYKHFKRIVNQVSKALEKGYSRQ